MNKKINTTRISKFLSFVLRHHPDKIGLKLDEQGWAEVEILLEKLNENGKSVTRELLEHVVETNTKKRFAFNGDRSKIRANQGHSIKIDHGYKPIQPPEILFHGTAKRYLPSILASGLEKRSRHHVHLSANLSTASNVGKRHGKLVILSIQALDMHKAGFEFFVSENQVWLTEHVPVKYIIQDSVKE